jgi:YidC/Oxa1 family membrane protein insertase
MDIKKTLLWVVFSVSGVMLFNNWQISQGNNPLPFLAPPPSVSNQQKINNTKADSVPKVTEQKVGGVSAPSQIPETNTVANIKTVTLKNNLIEIEISTKGATITKAILKQHLENNEPIILLQSQGSSTYLARSGLISMGLDLANHNDIYLEKVLEEGQKVIFSVDKNGVTLEKTFSLLPDSYVIAVQNKVINHSLSPVNAYLYTELIRDSNIKEESQFYSTFTGAAIYTDQQKYHEVAFSDIEKNKVKIPTALLKGEEGWIAMVQHYFASAWIPDPANPREMYFDKLDNSLFRVGLKSELPTVAPGANTIQNSKLFIGPEEDALLKEVAPGFDLIKDYGHLTIIAKPIFWLLTQIHHIVQNWGWAIIVLTIMIKLVFFPLSAASYKSMARMKEVQPRLMQMKEQYKNDPQKLNSAMMEMYKKEKINPLGGCLPVVIQIPVFISLYWVLLLSVEMRGAPWLGWIHDLSKPDTLLSDLVGIGTPIGILPILMAISMFIQTKLNPTPPDPVQAKVMLYMPLAFSLMFFFFPSGLVLYYIVNNVLSIAQQWQINKMFGVKNI